ncbi:hypothetical protein [Pseudarthrobacter sp. NamB4]|uniref:hypothetical protein n=1 Tax=Pseudarthrobacter sp. NamB4 TaxID=2576837 RepID=UPI001F0F5A73|nr:hypothetical protein [Pseudarthrobacter sp. NamB4]
MDRAAGALLTDAHALTACLPRSLAALQAGTVSWAHARTMADQTTGLDPDATAALEAHFLDPTAPDAARGCPAGQDAGVPVQPGPGAGGNATIRKAWKNGTPKASRTGG